MNIHRSHDLSDCTRLCIIWGYFAQCASRMPLSPVSAIRARLIVVIVTVFSLEISLCYSLSNSDCFSVLSKNIKLRVLGPACHAYRFRLSVESC